MLISPPLSWIHLRALPSPLYTGGGDENKLFIGGLAWATNDEGLYRAFENFRPTNARVVMEREDPSRSRGFGQ